MTGQLIKASVRVPGSQAELLESLLNEQGALAVTLADSGDQAILEPGVGETPLWQEVEVSGLFPAGADTDALASVIGLVPGLEAEAVRFDAVSEQRWERAWLKHFRPMRFGERLWIVPTGQQCPEADAVELRLDPGLAFGTGTHETTRMCLEWIDAHDFADRSVVDYGCGSGVLGIAAALKGARRVECIDNDPQAVLATRRNADRNGVGDRLVAMAPRPARPESADIVIANILDSTLVSLAPTLAGLLVPGGALVLAGILEHQAPAVREAFHVLGIDSQATAEINGWVLLSGDKT